MVKLMALSWKGGIAPVAAVNRASTPQDRMARLPMAVARAGDMGSLSQKRASLCDGLRDDARSWGGPSAKRRDSIAKTSPVENESVRRGTLAPESPRCVGSQPSDQSSDAANSPAFASRARDRERSSARERDSGNGEPARRRYDGYERDLERRTRRAAQEALGRRQERQSDRGGDRRHQPQRGNRQGPPPWSRRAPQGRKRQRWAQPWR